MSDAPRAEAGQPSKEAIEDTRGRGPAIGRPGRAPRSPGATPTLGLAMAVSMWGLAYVCRLPVIMAPGWLLLVGLLAAVTFWGWQAGRLTGRGWIAGLEAGLVASILNLLILGSLLADQASGAAAVSGTGSQAPPALIWLPGSLVVVGALAAVAAEVGYWLTRRGRPAPGRGEHQRAEPEPQEGLPGAAPGLVTCWSAVYARVTLVATFLLVIAGGLVTSNEAGLAVVDWPNTFGYNMFLYPLSRMTGGIYYEHAHRLFGSLVGLATIGLALMLWLRDRPAGSHRLEGTIEEGSGDRWRGAARWLSLVAVGAVVIQGVLGGLRVTGGLTLSTDPAVMEPSILLAVVHGVVGQLFLALVVVLAVISSRAWREPERAAVRSRTGGSLSFDPATDIRLQSALVGSLVAQLVLGALQRHIAEGIVIHVTMAAIVTTLAVVAGARAWGLYTRVDREGPGYLSVLGRGLLGLVTVQVALGIAALAVTQGQAVVGAPTTTEITLATAHQAGGALLLACSVALLLWSHRLLGSATVNGLAGQGRWSEAPAGHP